MFAYQYLHSNELSHAAQLYLPFDMKDVTIFDMIRAYHHVPPIESEWNRNHVLVFKLVRNDAILYYFIIDTYIPDTSDYRNVTFDGEDERNAYPETMLQYIIKSLSKRLITKQEIQQIYATNPYSPYESAYHEYMISALKTMKRNEEDYDTMVVRQTLYEEQEYLNVEQYYRPGGEGYHEAKNDFEELAMLLAWP